ncbi:MAG: MEDS domain-containing protein [Nitrospira sp.]|nr:MEDS domain-containing protein [Nitrospira sp.]
MPSQNTAFLIDAPIGSHFAQLYRKSKSLVESVSLFIETGLRRGSSVMVIASPKHTKQFLVRLRRNDLEPESYRTYGQLSLFNVNEILHECMRDGTFDLESFRQSVGSALESVLRFGRSETRVYGETVNILWQLGHTQTAIKLEEYWNDLAQLHPLSIFCGYMMDSHLEESYAHPLHEIGRTHSDFIATDEDKQFQIALDMATKEIIGIPLAEMLSLPDKEALPGEHSLPSGQRAMLWIKRYMPESSAKVLELTRRFKA